MTFITDEILSEGGITGTTISGGTFYGNGTNLTGVPAEFTGGTVTGATNFTGGLTANTFSATTISGGTFYGDGSNLTGISSSGTFTGGTVTGATNFTGGLTANTISATTYQNLPQVDTIYTADGVLTGNRTVTLNTNTLTFTENIFVANDVLVGKGPNFNSGNIVIGKDAGININTSTDNIIVGLSSSNSLLIGNKNISIGTNSQFLNENSNNNISIGVDSLYSNVNSDSNIAIGNSSLYFNESDNNIGIGEGTLSATTTGNQNVAIGSASFSNNTTGLRNTVIGYNAGNGNTSGNSITLIGRQANVGVDGLSNATAIGANSLVASSNSLVLGAAGTKVGIGTTNPTKDLQVIGDIESTTLSATSITGTTLYGDGSNLTGIPDASGVTNEIAYFTAGTTINSLTTATYPDLTELSYVKGVTSAIQTQLNGKEPTITNGYGISGTNTKSVSLTTAEAFITATTSITGTAYADITGGSISIGAGTWLIMATVVGSGGNTASLLHAAITNGANAVQVEGSQAIPASGGAAVNSWMNVSLSVIVTPAVTTTYKLRAARGQTTLTGTITIQNGSGSGGANNVSTGSNRGTGIRAIRIA